MPTYAEMRKRLKEMNAQELGTVPDTAQEDAQIERAQVQNALKVSTRPGTERTVLDIYRDMLRPSNADAYAQERRSRIQRQLSRNAQARQLLGSKQLSTRAVDESDKALRALDAQGQQQAEFVKQFKTDEDYTHYIKDQAFDEQSKAIASYADWKKGYRQAQADGDAYTAKKYLAWGQNAQDKGTRARAEEIARNATTQQLENLVEMPTGEKNLFRKELEARRAQEAQKRQQDASTLRSEMNRLYDEIESGFAVDENGEERLLTQAEIIERKNQLNRLQTAQKNAGTEQAGPITPEQHENNQRVEQWTREAQAGQLDTFWNRYMADNGQADAYAQAAEGSYQGDNADAQAINDQLLGIYARINEIDQYEESVWGTEAETGKELQSMQQERAQLQGQAEQLQAEADGKAKEERENAKDEQRAARELMYGKASVGRYIKESLMEGATNFANGFYQSLNVLVGKSITAAGRLFDEDYKSGLTRFSEKYKREVSDKQTAEAEMATQALGGGAALQTGRQVMGSIVENVPNTIMAIMTGGTAAAGGLATTQRAAIASMNQVGTGTAMKVVQDMLSDAQYWTSFMQELGSDYDEAEQNGASPLAATLYSTVTTLINAGIEVGGGIEEIGQESDPTLIGRALKAATGRDFKALDAILDSAGDEGTEEIKQYIVGALARKAIYDHDLPYYSNEEDAVINPSQMGENAMLGALTGGLLAGGNAAVDALGGAVTRTRRQDTAVGESIVSNDWQQTLGHIAQEEAGIKNRTVNKLIAGGQVSLRKLGKLYRETVKNVSEGTKAWFEQSLAKPIAETLRAQGYSGNMELAATAVAKAYGLENYDALTAKEASILAEPEVKEVLKQLEGGERLNTWEEQEDTGNAAEAATPHQPAAQAASPQGEALGTAQDANEAPSSASQGSAPSPQGEGLDAAQDVGARMTQWEAEWRGDEAANAQQTKAEKPDLIEREKKWEAKWRGDRGAGLDEKLSAWETKWRGDDSQAAAQADTGNAAEVATPHQPAAQAASPQGEALETAQDANEAPSSASQGSVPSSQGEGLDAVQKAEKGDSRAAAQADTGNAAEAATPHQPAAQAASPQGEALGTAQETEKTDSQAAAAPASLRDYKEKVKRARTLAGAMQTLKVMPTLQRGAITAQDVVENMSVAAAAAEKASISEDGQTHVTVDGQNVVAETVGIAWDKAGTPQLKVRINGQIESVAMDQVRFGSREAATRAMAASTIGGTEAANTLYNAKVQQGTRFLDYARDFMSAYRAAGMGIKKETLRYAGTLTALNELELDAAYEMGRRSTSAIAQAKGLNRTEAVRYFKAVLEAAGETNVNGLAAALADAVQRGTVSGAQADLISASPSAQVILQGREVRTDMDGTLTARAYGQSGRSYAELMDTLHGMGMTREQADSEAVRTAYQQAREQDNARAQRKAARPDTRGGLRDITAQEAEKAGVGVVNRESMSARQQAYTQALEALAGQLGVDMVLYESPVKDGVHVGRDGWYDRSTGTIYIDVEAGYKGEQAMMRVAAHELTHYIEQWNPKGYQSLRDLLLDYYYQKDYDTVRALVQEQIELAQQNGQRLGEAEAMDEVIANACEMMLSDAEAITAIAQKNQTLGKRIRAWIERTLSAMKEALKGLKPHSSAAKLLEKSRETLESARGMWLRALDEISQGEAQQAQETGTQGSQREAQDIATNGIRMGQSDGERYQWLRDTEIEAASVSAEQITPQQIALVNGMGYTKAMTLLEKAAKSYGLIADGQQKAATLQNKHLSIAAEFSKRSLSESLRKQSHAADGNQSTGNGYIAALLPVFKETYENAVPVLVQGDRYLYTVTDESSLQAFAYLLGAFNYNGQIVPVQFEVKRMANKQNSVYVVATIKEAAIMAASFQDTEASRRATTQPLTLSIEDVIANVNPEDTRILANLPSYMLTEEQQAGKREGLSTIKETALTAALSPANAVNHAATQSSTGAAIMAARQGTEVLGDATTQPLTLSIQDVIANVNPEDTRILANLPSYMLTEEQQAGKREGLKEKGEYLYNKARAAGQDVNAPVKLTQERIDRAIRDYGGSGDYSRAYMAMISPTDFLSLTATDADRIRTEGRVLVAEELRAEKETPFLQYDPETNEITGHEGRHRMAAMENSHVQETPVLLIPDGSEGRYIRQSVDSLTVSGQRYGARKAQGETTLHSLIPVNEKHRAELEASFGGGESWFRYSQRDGTLSDRQLLAQAFEGIVRTDADKTRLHEYKKRIEELDTATAQLKELEAQLSANYGTNWTQELREKQQEAQRLRRSIANADAVLLKMEGTEALQRVIREARSQVRSQARSAMQRYKEGVEKRELANTIKKRTERMARWISQPGKSGSVPKVLQASIANFLLGIEQSQNAEFKGEDGKRREKRFRENMMDLVQIVSELQSYQQADAEERIAHDFGGYLDLPKDFSVQMAQVVKSLETAMDKAGGRNAVDEMDLPAMRRLNEMLLTISTSVQQANELLTVKNYKHVSDAAKQTISDIRNQGTVKEMPRIFGIDVQSFLTWENTQPVRAFERFGEGGRQIFKALQAGQGQLAFDAQRIIALSEEAYKAEEAKAWNKEIKAFTLGENRTVRMPVSNLMSLYCLLKRDQAVGHILGEGIRVADFAQGSRHVRGEGTVITLAQAQQMVETLTPRQRAVADRLQQIMSTTGAEWGNYVSMKRFGYEMFTESSYFPIEVDSDRLLAKTDNSRGNELYRLLNISAAKTLTRGAKNRIMLKNIFDVYASHMSDMAQYHAMALPVLDAIKWLNYSEVIENADGTTQRGDSVRDAMRDTLGSGAGRYVQNLIRDISGRQFSGDWGEKASKALLGRANRQAVAANLRVALLQPTSIVRAGMELGGTEIMLGAARNLTRMRANMEEMQRYSGIAAWKDLGFFDMNISRSIESLIKHTETIGDRVMEKTGVLAEMGDKITWAAMWEGCKENVRRNGARYDTQDAFLRAVAEKFEDVIYKTQVVDSILTRSQMMRSTAFASKWLTSFMSEPTTTYNMLLAAYDRFAAEVRGKAGAQRVQAIQRAWQKHGKTLGRTFAVYGLSAVLSALVESVADAARDNDDYETYIEKWLQAFWGNLGDNLNPLTLLPLVSNLWELASGHEPESPLFSGIYTLKESVDKAIKYAQGESKAEWYGVAYPLLQGASQVSGLPFATATREVVTLWNNTAAYLDPRLRIEKYQSSTSKGTEALYRAIMEENTGREALLRRQLAANDVSDAKIASGLEKQIKLSLEDGAITEEEARELLTKYGLKKEKGEMVSLTADDAYFKVQKWAYDTDKAEEDADYSPYLALEEAVRTGSGVESAMRELTSHGYSEKTVNNKLKILIRDAYLDGDISEQRAGDLLTRYTTKTEDGQNVKLDADDAYWLRKEWKYENGSDLDFSRYTELTDALRAGRNVDGAIKELTDHGHDEKDVAARVKSITGDLYAKGEISQSQAQSLLKKYGRKTSGGILAALDDTDVWGAMNQMEYRKLTGESSASDYALVYYAISNQRSPQAYIDDALAHGKSRSSIASGVTSRFKEEYQRLLKTDLNAASVLKGRLCATFDYLGYNGLKKVGDWEK